MTGMAENARKTTKWITRTEPITGFFNASNILLFEFFWELGLIVVFSELFLLDSGRKNRTNSKLTKVSNAAAHPGAQKP